MTKKSSNKLTLTLQFDMNHPDSFAAFCAALAKAGFQKEMELMLKKLQAEAKKRGIEDAVNLSQRQFWVPHITPESP